MYISIDASNAAEGFMYTNLDGEEEFVKILLGGVEVTTRRDSVSIYHEDIPKLIKALQASYNYKRGV